MPPLPALVRTIAPTAKARLYFGVQAVGGAAWWVGVFASEDVQRWTLGDWSPELLVGPDLALFVGASAMAAVLGRRVWAYVAAVWTTLITAALTLYALITRDAGWGALLMAIAAGGTMVATLTLHFGRLPVRWFFVGPFAFRVAANRSGARHLRHSLVQLVIFWTGLLVLLPVLLSAAERWLRLAWEPLQSSGWAWVGAMVFLAASGLGLWACVSMALRGEGTPLPAATARRLVVVGPYRRVRNPMALAGALQTVGVGLLLGSWLVLVSSVAGAVVWNTFIRPEEEADLAARFGPGYEAYRQAVRCWVPTWRPLPTAADQGTAAVPR